MAPQSLRSALQAALGQVAQPLVRHKQSTGLFVSGLGPQGAERRGSMSTCVNMDGTKTSRLRRLAPRIGPGNPCLARCLMGRRVASLAAALE
jgi:hypothetical protein